MMFFCRELLEVEFSLDFQRGREPSFHDVVGYPACDWS